MNCNNKEAINYVITDPEPERRRLQIATSPRIPRSAGVWRAGTYYFDISGAYDFQYNFRGWAPDPTTQPVFVEGTLTNPQIVYQSWERNSDYPWMAFGNVTCFIIKISNLNDTNSQSYFNLGDYDCTDGGCGYSGMFKLYNTY